MDDEEEDEDEDDEEEDESDEEDEDEDYEDDDEDDEDEDEEDFYNSDDLDDFEESTNFAPTEGACPRDPPSCGSARPGSEPNERVKVCADTPAPQPPPMMAVKVSPRDSTCDGAAKRKAAPNRADTVATSQKRRQLKQKRNRRRQAAPNTGEPAPSASAKTMTTTTAAGAAAAPAAAAPSSKAAAQARAQLRLSAGQATSTSTMGGENSASGAGYTTVNDSWFINYNGIIVILPIVFNSFRDKQLERSYQRYSHGQRKKSLMIVHTIDLLMKVSLLVLPIFLLLQTCSQIFIKFPAASDLNQPTNSSADSRSALADSLKPLEPIIRDDLWNSSSSSPSSGRWRLASSAGERDHHLRALDLSATLMFGSWAQEITLKNYLLLMATRNGPATKAERLADAESGSLSSVSNKISASEPDRGQQQDDGSGSSAAKSNLELLAQLTLGVFCSHLSYLLASCLNLFIICVCLFLPHRHLTSRLSFIALFTWFLMCFQNYALYSSNEPIYPSASGYLRALFSFLLPSTEGSSTNEDLANGTSLAQSADWSVLLSNSENRQRLVSVCLLRAEKRASPRPEHLASCTQCVRAMSDRQTDGRPDGRTNGRIGSERPIQLFHLSVRPTAARSPPSLLTSSAATNKRSRLEHTRTNSA